MMTVSDIVKHAVPLTKIRLIEEYHMVAEMIVGKDDEDEKLGSYLNWEAEMITAMYNVLEVYL